MLANSLKFIDRVMPWLPTIAKITKPIATTTPILMYLLASGGRAASSFGLLYKTSFVVKVVN